MLLNRTIRSHRAATRVLDDSDQMTVCVRIEICIDSDFNAEAAKNAESRALLVSTTTGVAWQGRIARTRSDEGASGFKGLR
jgi:hypothetical protein